MVSKKVGGDPRSPPPPASWALNRRYYAFFTILYFTEEKINKVKKGGITVKIRFELRAPGTYDMEEKGRKLYRIFIYKIIYGGIGSCIGRP